MNPSFIYKSNDASQKYRLVALFGMTAESRPDPTLLGRHRGRHDKSWFKYELVDLGEIYALYFMVDTDTQDEQDWHSGKITQKAIESGKLRIWTENGMVFSSFDGKRLTRLRKC